MTLEELLSFVAHEIRHLRPPAPFPSQLTWSVAVRGRVPRSDVRWPRLAVSAHVGEPRVRATAAIAGMTPVGG